MMKKLLCSLLFTVLTVGFVDAQYGNVSGGSPLAPIITTSTSATINIPDPVNGTDFGIVSVGSTPGSQTFTFTSIVGTQLLVGLGPITGADATEFNVSSAVPSTITGVGMTSSFTVNFDPTTTGLKSAIIEVRVRNFPPPFTSESYFFEINGEASAATPNIQIFGDDTIEIPNPFFGPAVTDNTHYGDVVANLESRTRTFTVSNALGTADLIIDQINALLSEADFTFDLGALTLPITVPVGSTFDLDIIFTPTSVNPINEFVEILTNDVDFYFEVLGIGILGSPDMEVFGNSTLITSGDITPNAGDHTVFPSVDIAAGGVTRTFTIENNGTADLNLTSLSPIVDITGADAADFTVTTNPTTPIVIGASTTFVVTFDPTTVGVKDATIEINNNGVDNPYTFAIQGTATDATAPSGNPLMITQYYEGAGGPDNNWLEIKNISTTETTIGGFYNIAVFLDDNATTSGASNITNSSPDFSESIPSLDPGEIILYRVSAASTLPLNIGTTNIVTSDVCTFTGNDVIVISLTTGIDCYAQRVDVIGEVGTTTTNWGANKSIVKGCGTTLQPAIVYDPTNILYDEDQFIELTLAEVDVADASMDIAIGTQSFGSTTWTTTWSDGIPDRTREVIIDGAYTNSNGSLSACNLTINSGASVILDSNGAGSDYVLVRNNLINNGVFTLGDTESLTMTISSGTVTGSLTKIEKTTPLSNFKDYTYWSSPVNTTIASAFTGVDPNRIYQWRTPSSGDTGGWDIASGSMTEGRGYYAEAPSSITTGQQHQVDFVGTPNTGSVDVSVGIDLTNTDTYGGYNIIGNPYPSAIDIDIFLKNQANNEINNGDDVTTDATIWLWTHGTPISGEFGEFTGEYTSADYATYNLVGGVGSGSPAGAAPAIPTNIIGSGQGFLIRVITPGNGLVRFNNSMRVVGGNDTQFFKSNQNTIEKDRVWLNMSSEDGRATNQILIGFMEEATDGVDRGYDASHLGSGNIVFYSNIEDNFYAIQGLGAFNQTKEVSLGFYTALENKHKISLGNVEGVLADEDMYLVDNELNIVHDLKQGAYEFDVTASGNYKERFTLKFNSGVLSTEEVVLNNSFTVYSQNETLKIKAGLEVATLKVYDVTGRLLIDFNPNSAAFDVPSQSIKAGTVLFLNATMKDGSVVSKKAIKY